MPFNILFAHSIIARVKGVTGKRGRSCSPRWLSKAELYPEKQRPDGGTTVTLGTASQCPP